MVCNASRACAWDPLGINPGIIVEVREAGSGRPAASSALGLVFRGTAVADTLRSYHAEQDTSAATLTSQQIGAGRYLVTIERPGFATWTRDNVEALSAAATAAEFERRI